MLVNKHFVHFPFFIKNSFFIKDKKHIMKGTNNVNLADIWLSSNV
jgi:hypothetical protein